MVKLAYEGLKGPNSGELEAIAVSESAKYSAISESYDKGVIDYKYSNSAFKALEQKYAASGKKMESEYRQLVDILEGKSHSSYQKGYRENWNSRLKKFNNELREITGSYELDLQQKQEIEGLLNNSYLDKAIKSNKKHSKSNEFLRAWAVSYVNGIYSPEKTEAKTKGLDDKVSNVVSKEDSNQQDDIRKKPVVQKPTIRKPTFDKPTYHKPTYHKPTNADGPCENNNQQQTYARPVLTNSKPVCGNTTVSDTTTPVLKPIPPAYPVTYPAYHDDRFSNHANSENSGDSNDFDFLTGSSDLEAIVSSQETNGNGKKPYVPFMDRAVKAIAKPLIYIVTLSMLLTGAGGTAKNNAIDKELNRPELIEQYKGDNPTYTSASAGENNLYLDLRSHKNDSETDANNNAQNNNKNNDSDRNNSNENNENLNNSDKDPASAVQAVPTNQYQRTARPAQNRYPAYASAKEVPAIMAGNNAGNNVDSANVAVAAAPVYQAPQIANPNYETGNATDNATGTVQVDAQQGNTVPQVYVPKVQAYQAPTNNVPAADNTAANNIAANNAVADNIGANPSANDSVTKTYGGRAITFVDASAASTTDASANSDNPNLENIVDANTISGKTADANQAAMNPATAPLTADPATGTYNSGAGTNNAATGTTYVDNSQTQTNNPPANNSVTRSYGDGKTITFVDAKEKPVYNPPQDNISQAAQTPQTIPIVDGDRTEDKKDKLRVGLKSDINSNGNINLGANVSKGNYGITHAIGAGGYSSTVVNAGKHGLGQDSSGNTLLRASLNNGKTNLTGILYDNKDGDASVIVSQKGLGTLNYTTNGTGSAKLFSGTTKVRYLSNGTLDFSLSPSAIILSSLGVGVGLNLEDIARGKMPKLKDLVRFRLQNHEEMNDQYNAVIKDRADRGIYDAQARYEWDKLLFNTWDSGNATSLVENVPVVKNLFKGTFKNKRAKKAAGHIAQIIQEVNDGTADYHDFAFLAIANQDTDPLAKDVVKKIERELKMTIDTLINNEDCRIDRAGNRIVVLNENSPESDRQLGTCKWFYDDLGKNMRDAREKK